MMKMMQVMAALNAKKQIQEITVLQHCMQFMNMENHLAL